MHGFGRCPRKAGEDSQCLSLLFRLSFLLGNTCCCCCMLLLLLLLLLSLSLFLLLFPWPFSPSVCSLCSLQFCFVFHRGEIDRSFHGKLARLRQALQIFSYHNKSVLKKSAVACRCGRTESQMMVS